MLGPACRSRCIRPCAEAAGERNIAPNRGCELDPGALLRLTGHFAPESVDAGCFGAKFRSVERSALGPVAVLMLVSDVISVVISA